MFRQFRRLGLFERVRDFLEEGRRRRDLDIFGGTHDLDEFNARRPMHPAAPGVKAPAFMRFPFGPYHRILVVEERQIEAEGIRCHRLRPPKAFRLARIDQNAFRKSRTVAKRSHACIIIAHFAQRQPQRIDGEAQTCTMATFLHQLAKL